MVLTLKRYLINLYHPMSEIDINIKRGQPDAQKPLQVFWNESTHSNTQLLPLEWGEKTHQGAYPRIAGEKQNLVIPIGKNNAGYVAFDFNIGLNILAGGSMLSGVGMFRRVSLLSLLKEHTPKNLQIVLIDPIGLMSDFNNIPHLKFPRIRTAEECENIFKWLQEENSRRLDFLGTEKTTTNIWSYNKKIGEESGTIIPNILIIVSELADIKDIPNIENILIRIWQVCRATSIYFMITTQQPSELIITKKIKEIFYNRIAFQMPYEAESRLFIDQSGAENLLGQGDMLFKHGEDEISRLQGLYVPVNDTKTLVEKLTTDYSFLDK